jgi:RHS repeat-associated protein
MRAFNKGSVGRLVTSGLVVAFCWTLIGADLAFASKTPPARSSESAGEATRPRELTQAEMGQIVGGCLKIRCKKWERDSCTGDLVCTVWEIEIFGHTVTCGSDMHCSPMSSISPARGELWLAGAFMGWGAKGPGVGWRLWYNSGNPDEFGLGAKRRNSYNSRLTFPSSSEINLESPSGNETTFTWNAGTQRWEPEAGAQAALEYVGASDKYVLSVPSATSYRWRAEFYGSGALQGKLYRLRRGINARWSTCVYDANGRLVRVDDDLGRQLAMAYNANGYITSVSDPTARQTTLTYDGSNRVSTVTDPDGHVTTYGYDSSNRVTSVTMQGQTWQYAYDSSNRVTGAGDPLGHWTYYTYTGDPVTRCVITDPLNHTTTYDYDGSGRLITLTNALGGYRTFTYDADNNRTSETNERGYTTNYQYNAYGDRTRVTDPLNNVTQYEYGYNAPDDHLLKQITDPLGRITTFAYDANGNLLTLTDPNGNVTTNTYNADGLLSSATDARNNTTTYAYDSAGNMTSVTDPLSHTTTFAYDAIGNRTSVTDANNNTTYYSYDGQGRVTQITSPGSAVRRFIYNCCKLTSVIDENGKTTTYNYDAAERLTSVIDADGKQTTYAYDNAGNLTSVTDANNRSTTYTYNANNWLTRTDYPDATYEAFTYYATGALYTRRDGRGQVTTYARSALDQVTTIDYPAGTDPTFTYDAKGRVTRMTDGSCDTYYRYDTYGGVTKYDQLLAVERKYGSMTTYRATAYNYDQNYNRTWMQDGAGNVTTYAYNANNALTGVTTGGQTTTFAYDAVGNRAQKTLPNGAYTTYNYSNRNWLTSLANRKSDATLVSSYAYAHDYVGNRTAMTEANGDVSSYVYDNVYRLVSEEKRDSSNNLLWRYQYTYDGVGNRLTMNNSGVITYTYDANNKLTQLVGPSGTTTFGYDGNGNMTSMVAPGPITTTYGYDYENRLTSVTAPTYTAAYTYAADGVRLRAQESNHAYPDRWFQYDGVRPVLEGTLSGNTFTTVNRYVLEGSSYYDPLISASIGGSNRFYLCDGLGSTRQLLDGNQAVTDTYQYEAFGNLMGGSGSTPNPYKYVGSLGYYQTGSSLQHLGARYYLPEVGRFGSKDPAAPRRSEYGYAYANATNAVDPTGLAILSGAGAAAGCVTGGIVGALGSIGKKGGLGRAGCEVGLKCLSGAIAGAAVANLGPAAAGCVSGFVSGGLGMVASGQCERWYEGPQCPRDWKCAAFDVAASTIVGCVAGSAFGHASDYSEKVHGWVFGIAGSLLGNTFVEGCKAIHEQGLFSKP